MSVFEYSQILFHEVLGQDYLFYNVLVELAICFGSLKCTISTLRCRSLTSVPLQSILRYIIGSDKISVTKPHDLQHNILPRNLGYSQAYCRLTHPEPTGALVEVIYANIFLRSLSQKPPSTIVAFPSYSEPLLSILKDRDVVPVASEILYECAHTTIFYCKAHY